MNDLRLAAFLGHDQILEWIVNRDGHSNINLTDSSGVAALVWASELGHLEVVKLLLLRQGADVNAQGGEYGNALQAASYGDHVEVVKLLLDNGADVNAKGGYYSNVLQGASLVGHIEVVKLLPDKGADMNAQGRKHDNALVVASALGYVGVVKLLLDHSADVNAQGRDCGNAMQEASVGGRRDVVKGADVNAQGEYCCACDTIASLLGYECARMKQRRLVQVFSQTSAAAGRSVVEAAMLVRREHDLAKLHSREGVGERAQSLPSKTFWAIFGQRLADTVESTLQINYRSMT